MSSNNVDREIVTVALGNYSTLVAAQYVNGTTQYDLERETLYTDHRGVGPSDGELSATGGSTRVPRLIILDHHHAARIVKTVPLEDATQEAVQESASPKVGNDGGDDDDASSCEFDDFSYIPETLQWNPDDDKDDERHRDPNDGCVCVEERLKQRDKNNAKAIFDVRDRFVPWHHYIRTGLHHRSYTLIPDGHHDVGGAALTHSAGHGLATMKPSSHASMDATCDGIRHMLESADHPQGVQCFVDADGCMTGAGVNLLHDVEESYGAKLPRLVAAAFEPFPSLDAEDDDFAKVRAEEIVLNQVFAVGHLAKIASCYVPFHVGEWDTLHAAAAVRVPTNDNVATAQLIATAWDTALYGLRVGGGATQSSPLWYMRDVVSVLRPCESMRVAAAFASVPLRVRLLSDEGDPCFWTALQRNPLMPLTKSSEPQQAPSFLALSHEVTHDATYDSGRVLGHVVSLRGMAKLVDAVYPRQEALMRYCMPLRTSTLLVANTDEEYPVSSTFPASALFAAQPAAGGQVQTAAAMGLSSLPVASHLACTYNSAAMLGRLVHAYDLIVRYRRHAHRRSYAMEDDDWKELSEDLHQVLDDYLHDSADADDDNFDA